jgi:high-affinity K+ transport system ATPase subunit B
MHDYAQTSINIAAYISLFVCLIPTTIGGLLSAIGIAGMDRALRANVITKSGKAVENRRRCWTRYCWIKREQSLLVTGRQQIFG